MLNVSNKRAVRQSVLPLLCLIFAYLAAPQTVGAQEFALKTNLLYDATATINVGAEVKVAPKWSIDLSGNLNSWSFANGRRWKHWMLQPEARYWLCEGTAGHFVAVHALGGKFNFGHISSAHNFLGLATSALRDNRYQGWAMGAGVAYGYSWILGMHWNLEAELGLGYIHANYDIYECAGCGRRTGHGTKGFFAPTKTAINIKYVF